MCVRERERGGGILGSCGREKGVGIRVGEGLYVSERERERESGVRLLVIRIRDRGIEEMAERKRYRLGWGKCIVF